MFFAARCVVVINTAPPGNVSHKLYLRIRDMVFKVAGIGEILWDVFPDGPRFGGAPANFSCSAAELAQSAAEVWMVSAVGNDTLGHDAIGALQQRGVRTSMVQVRDEPTGRVLVELDQSGAASYQFEENSAWDFLHWGDEMQRFAADCDAVCFGTLGQRAADSCRTIRNFLEATNTDALRILDVNLRQPYYSDELILESLEAANVLKLNDEELPYVGKLAGCHGDHQTVMQQLADRYQLRCVALTRGADGALIVSGDSVSDLPGTKVNVVDTVGAGDAFTASMTLGLLAEEDLDEVNRCASAVAAYVCAHAGGTMPFPANLQRQ